MKQLFSQDEIRSGVERLAGQVRETYGQRPLTIVGILTGSLVMLADLIRHLDNPLRVALIRASQYRGQGNRRTALVIDDKLLPNLAQIALHHPASVRSAVLLRKTGRCEVAIQPDFVVFDIPDEFVVGYGLDHEDRYRNLPYVAALEPGDLKHK
jgi:hypoxanthine phosphoribosyltransferase